jgi:hypothetical protein
MPKSARLEGVQVLQEDKMKKLIVAVILGMLLVSSASAQLLVGAKASAMGGAGVASVRDLACAYYNPAAIVDTGTASAKLSLGIASQNLDKISTVAGGFSDPAKYMLDNYANALDFNGTGTGMFGFSIKGVGVSVIPEQAPLLDLGINKLANSLEGTVRASANAAATVTLGRKFSLSWLPADLDLGINLKYLYGANGSLSTSGLGGEENYGTGAGTGIDLGVLTTVKVPMLTEVAVGFVARDLMSSMTVNNKSRTLTVNGTEYTVGPEVSTGDSTVTMPTSYVLGASAIIPGIGAQVAMDIDNVCGATPATNTHLGIEYPLMAGMVTARGGIATGSDLSLLTLGAKIGLPIFIMDVAYVQDNKNASNNSYVVDFTAGF